MIIRLNLIFLLLFQVFTLHLIAQNTNPVVSNVTFSISGNTLTIHYDVADAEQSTVSILLYGSSDGGSTWDFYFYGSITGDIGAGVSVGTGKTILWSYAGGELPNFKIKIVANDETADGSPCAGLEKVYYQGGPNSDANGAYYTTIQIGSQCWLKENLNVGTMIPSYQNQVNGNGIEKYCETDQEAFCSLRGGLYQWGEAMQYSTTESAQGICPSGWHIPTLNEFQSVLALSVSSSANSLKAVGQDGTSTNTSGFSALFIYSTFSNCYYWTSTITSGGGAREIELKKNENYIYYWNLDQNNNYTNVRCVK